MFKEKKVLILTLVVILLVAYIAFDRFFYEHNARNLAGIFGGDFGTVGLATTKLPGINSTTTVAKNLTPTPTANQSRGVPPESPTNYTDNGDGTVTDNHTGLVWSKCVQGMSGAGCTLGSPALREWSKAVTDCTSVTLSGKKDWRMPTLKELESIVDTGVFDPSVNRKFFIRTTNDPYWTATSPAEYQADKFTVLFSDGSVYHQNSGGAAATRCVRGISN